VSDFISYCGKIQVPGSAPRTVVRRLESKGKKKKKPGRIVMLREEVLVPLMNGIMVMAI
jgi:hypothetical protein